MSSSPEPLGPARTWRNAVGWVLLAVLGASLAWMLWLGHTRPAHNFDLVDYVAMAVEWVESTPEDVHRRTYEILAAELPPELYESFTQGNRFRQEIFEDPQKFSDNLGFHRGRVLYSLGVLTTHLLGAGWVESTSILNLVFLALTILLVLRWARRHLDLASSSLLGMAVLYSPPVVMLAPASSPDAIAMFLVTLGLYIMLELRNFLPAVIVLTLAVLVRSDFVLICFGIGTALWFLPRSADGPGRRFVLLWLAVSALLYLGVGRFARDPGWWAVFIAPAIRVADLDAVPEFRWSRYLNAMGRQVESVHYFGYDIANDGSFVRGSNFVFVYLALAAAGCLLALRTGLVTLRLHVVVLVGLLLSTAVRYVLFPFIWDRYYVYLWVPVPMVLACMAATWVKYVEKRERPGIA